MHHFIKNKYYLFPYVLLGRILIRTQNMTVFSSRSKIGREICVPAGHCRKKVTLFNSSVVILYENVMEKFCKFTAKYVNKVF